MASDRWTEVDGFVAGLLAEEDEVLVAALDAAARAGMPEIQVSPPQARLLQILARAVGARSMLEFGTLAGYSTIWLARALPAEGRLITLEADPSYADVARESLERAQLDPLVDLRVGPALDLLPELDAAKPAESFSQKALVWGESFRRPALRHACGSVTTRRTECVSTALPRSTFARSLCLRIAAARTRMGIRSTLARLRASGSA